MVLGLVVRCYVFGYTDQVVIFEVYLRRQFMPEVELIYKPSRESWCFIDVAMR